MSIYGSIPGLGDPDDDETLGAPWVYQGSHILPAEDDPRGGSIHLADIPSHITRDGRDDQPEDGRPWPWLRLSVNTITADPTVLLNPAQARHHVAQVAAWADEADPRPGMEGLRERYAALFRHAPGELRLGDEPPGPIADAVLAVRDEEMDRLRARIAELEVDRAGADEEINDLMLHNDATCEAVAERDRLRRDLETANEMRAEVQRDRDQHAAVLREVLSRFRAGDGGASEAWATREDLDRWRSVVAPTVERPWWEQVREWEQAAVDATHHVLELKAALARVRAVVDRIKVGAPWAANQADITARLQAALDGDPS